ncbi:MAG: hypothetical protein JW818_04250 [Pirellulales bacterium]|nr:hypothetical protein [Pirellulales bacterium]
MAMQYKVVCQTWCLTSHSKAKAIEHHLNHLSPQGWEFTALESVIFLGIDVGFYLVLQRPEQDSPNP